MDYLTQPLGFKVKKVARYIRLYGVSRTYVKVLGQRHKQRKFAQQRPCASQITVLVLCSPSTVLCSAAHGHDTACMSLATWRR